MKSFPNAFLPASQAADCPHCGQCSRFDFQYNHRIYFRCPACSLIHLVRKTEEADDPVSYYRENYYNDYVDDQSERSRTSLNDHILDLIGTNVNKGRLLDIGCGCGFFLSRARSRGWDIRGVDPSEQSIAKAQELIGEAASVGALQDVNNGGLFDVVTMINVLDHLRSPDKALASFREVLRPGGLLYLRFPNGFFHSSIIRMQARITDKPILNRLLIFHEYAFTPPFIRRVLKEHGYEHIKIYNSRISGAALYRQSPVLGLFGSGFNGFLWLIVSFLKHVSDGRWLLGPSLEVTAVKR
ncbi:MAG TPA: class I SAM-dependent methyltransferase [Syntrophales bacterium]|nr:class I SAM-dependent methyltransferase [Syntrophales bacterium]